MAVLQLVRQGGVNAAAQLAPLPNPQGKPPEHFFENGQDAFLAGSDDLIWISFHLSRHRFNVIEISLVDSYFQPIEETLQEEINDQIVPALRSKADYEEVRDVVHDAIGDLMIDLVRLHDDDTGLNLSIAQEGVVTTANNYNVAHLSTALKAVL